MIIISYIFMYIYNNYKEKFVSQVIDNDFSILSVNSNLEYKNCDIDQCNIKFLDKKIDENNIKSVYYITNDNDIYILNNKIGIKKSKIVTTDNINITAIDFSNDFKYGFAGIKSHSTKAINIYYTTDYANTWNKLIFSYDNINTFKEKLKNEYSDEKYLNKYKNLEFLNNKDILIDNIIVKYTDDNKPEGLMFSTIGNFNYKNVENDEINYYTELTLKYINLINDLNNFEDHELEKLNYKCSFIKYYYDTNIEKTSLKVCTIKKLLNYKNDFFILLNTNGNNSENLLLNYKSDYTENLYITNYLNDIKLININNIILSDLSNKLNNFLLGSNEDSLFKIDLNNIDNIKNNNSIYHIKYGFEDYINIPPDFNSTINILDINTFNIKNIKGYDIDFKYFTEESKSYIKEFLLYYVTNENKIFSKSLELINNKEDITLNLIESSEKEIIYSKDDIKFINNLFIHPKNKIDDESSLFIGTDKKILFYHDNKWKELNNYSLEYNKYNTAKFINDITDTRKILFNGDNLLEKHKIYNFEFKIDKHVDILMIGGGGGGGYGGGGGGGGDVKLFKNIKMPAGKYRLLVGSGGAEGTEDNDLGKYGNNSEIEMIDSAGNFEKLVVAGGGGGGSYTKDATRTPINGIIGNKLYSSGGGGGGGGRRGIGGVGNGISGNGSPSYFDDILYGGGGGSGGYYNLFNDIKKKYNNGLSANKNSLGIGGKSTKIIDKYIYNNINYVSGGGYGGIYGEINNENEKSILDKINILDNKKNKIYGKGGNGSIIITNINNYENNSELLKKIINNNDSKGTEGVIIIYGSKSIYKEYLEKDNDISKRDRILNLYKLSNRDIQKESQDYNNNAKKEMLERLELKNKFGKKIQKVRKNKYKKNIYELERKSNNIQMEYINDKKVIDPISDAYLPYSQTEIKKIDISDPLYNINKYKIITLYKQLLYRQPTSEELNEWSRKIMINQINLEKIKRHIINSDEYIRVIKLQSNDPNPNLIYADNKQNIYGKIAELYLTELNEEIPKALLGPLKDLYHYLQYNEHLFRAILIHSNFENFKSEIIENKKLIKNDIIKIFKKYFTEKEIKDKANDIQRFDKYNKSDKVKDIFESNNTDKYAVTNDYDEEDNSKLPDLKNLILQDNYNYYLWDKKVSNDIDKNDFEEKLDEIKQLREEVNKIGKETFVNFDIKTTSNDNLEIVKNIFSNKSKPLLNKKAYEKMNKTFSNIFN